MSRILCAFVIIYFSWYNDIHTGMPHRMYYVYMGHLNNFLLLYRGAGGAEKNKTQTLHYISTVAIHLPKLSRVERAGVVCFFFKSSAKDLSGRPIVDIGRYMD